MRPPGVHSFPLAGARPFPLAIQYLYSFVSHVVSSLLSPRFGACTAGVRPFPLAMQRFCASCLPACPGVVQFGLQSLLPRGQRVQLTHLLLQESGH